MKYPKQTSRIADYPFVRLLIEGKRWRLLLALFVALGILPSLPGGLTKVSAAPFGYAWGHGGLGQLGNSTTGQSATPVQVSAVPGGQMGLFLAAGENHSLAIANDGTAWAWGDRSVGQLGDGTSSVFPPYDSGPGHRPAGREKGDVHCGRASS
jgi:hypothetical protein